jgi:hypothetical protein
MNSGSTIHIVSHRSVNGLAFGLDESELFEALGRPDKVQRNYTGEIEYLYGNEIYRCFEEQLVECTFPDEGRFTVDGVEILSIFSWLAARNDSTDRAKFRVSPTRGIAYDYRDPSNGSVTVFAKGRWDALLLN